MYKFTQYKKEYKHQIIDLLGNLWYNLSYEERERLLNWKYLDSPFLEKPLIYLMLDGEKVICFRGIFPNIYQLEGKDILVGILADGVTHPDYRRKGLFLKLTEYALKDITQQGKLQVCLSLSSGWPATFTYLKAGFEKFSEKKEVYRFFLMNFFKKKPTSFVGEHKTQAMLGQNCTAIISNYINNQEVADYLLQKRHNKIELIKSAQVLAWRYKNPVKPYYFLVIKRKDKIAGFASFLLMKPGRALLVDFSMDDVIFFKRGLKFFANQLNLYLIQTSGFLLAPEELKKIRKNCFYEWSFLFRLFGKKTLPPILIKIMSGGINDNVDFISNSFLNNSSNWKIKLIDSDGV